MTDTIHASIYVDNWFMMFVNGKLIAVGPIELLPHNQVNVDFLPDYPIRNTLQKPRLRDR